MVGLRHALGRKHAVLESLGLGQSAGRFYLPHVAASDHLVLFGSIHIG